MLIIMKSPLFLRRMGSIVCMTGLLVLGVWVQAEAAGTVPAPAVGPAPAPSRLGDLDPFRSIAAEVADLVGRGDLPGARRRIRDLEIAWDRAEAGLKPRSAREWHRIDKAIDRALEAVRADPPSLPQARASMEALLQVMDSPTAPSAAL